MRTPIGPDGRPMTTEDILLIEKRADDCFGDYCGMYAMAEKKDSKQLDRKRIKQCILNCLAVLPCEAMTMRRIALLKDVWDK